jgi:hypothetical protein
VQLRVGHDPWLTYFAIYIPVRWIEWAIVAFALTAPPRPRDNFLLGSGRSSRLWRLGGIVVSHLADIPLILMAGGVTGILPVGRFLC